MKNNQSIEIIREFITEVDKRYEGWKPEIALRKNIEVIKSDVASIAYTKDMDYRKLMNEQPVIEKLLEEAIHALGAAAARLK